MSPGASPARATWPLLPACTPPLWRSWVRCDEHHAELHAELHGEYRTAADHRASGASGATGLHLIRQALDRGHTVVAIARRPERIDIPNGPRLLCRAADVTNPDSITEALRDSSVVVSGLGVVGKEQGDVLSAGARAVIAAQPERMVWLGAFGTGPSAAAAGPFTRGLLRVVLRAEIQDKVRADTLILAAGGTLVHAGPLSDRPGGTSPRAVLLDQVPRRIFPAPISRASVAAVMLDAAESGANGVIVPLER